MTNILIIGATGQIGYTLTTALAKTEHQLSVLVRDGSRLTFPERVNVIESAVFDTAAFHRALTNIDHVIYGVGLPEQFLIDDTLFDQINRGLLQRFLAALRVSETCCLTYISTYEVFEEIGGVIRESQPIADERSVQDEDRACGRHAPRSGRGVGKACSGRV